jgi:hypothetical protein
MVSGGVDDDSSQIPKSSHMSSDEEVVSSSE